MAYADPFAEANALLQQFQQRGQQSYDSIMKSYKPYSSTQDSRSDAAQEEARESSRRRQQAEAARRKTQSGVTDALRGVMPNVKDIIAQRTAEGQDRLEGARQSALQQLMQKNKMLREQANRTLTVPVGAPQQVPTLAPPPSVDNVSPDAALAGANAATQSFFIAPSSTQSQFTVGAPVGGGYIGPRQRASTDDLTSTPDRLGSKQKDQF